MLLGRFPEPTWDRVCSIKKKNSITLLYIVVSNKMLLCLACSFSLQFVQSTMFGWCHDDELAETWILLGDGYHIKYTAATSLEWATYHHCLFVKLRACRGLQLQAQTQWCRRAMWHTRRKHKCITAVLSPWGAIISRPTGFNHFRVRKT